MIWSVGWWTICTIELDCKWMLFRQYAFASLRLTRAVEAMKQRFHINRQTQLHDSKLTINDVTSQLPLATGVILKLKFITYGLVTYETQSRSPARLLRQTLVLDGRPQNISHALILRQLRKTSAGGGHKLCAYAVYIPSWRSQYGAAPIFFSVDISRLAHGLPLWFRVIRETTMTAICNETQIISAAYRNRKTEMISLLVRMQWNFDDSFWISQLVCSYIRWWHSNKNMSLKN